MRDNVLAAARRLWLHWRTRPGHEQAAEDFGQIVVALEREAAERDALLSEVEHYVQTQEGLVDSEATALLRRCSALLGGSAIRQDA